MGIRGLVVACALVLLGTACTPGAQVAPNNQIAGGAILINMALVNSAPTLTPFGNVQAYNPDFVTVAVGSTIQFHNNDNFNHTATMIAGVFPPSNNIPIAALQPSGTDLANANWSTGDVTPNAFSQTLRASTPGTYLFGCQHHYPVMRGVIIVQ